MRSQPTHCAEMVNQWLFGEPAKVIGKEKDWMLIELMHDKYEGWVNDKYVTEITEDEYKLITHNQVFVTQTSFMQFQDASKMWLTPGTPFWTTNFWPFETEKPDIKHLMLNIHKPDFQNIEFISKMFLHTPYLWGGRSFTGIDCSGLVQIVYRLLGVNLPRDASQQVENGVVINFLEEAQTGDLAFFDNEDGKIVHVGILLNNKQIIHSSGKVAIESIDNQGIYSDYVKNYTHKLRVIKRIL
jgi:hypothetical protein